MTIAKEVNKDIIKNGEKIIKKTNNEVELKWFNCFWHKAGFSL